MYFTLDYDWDKLSPILNQAVKLASPTSLFVMCALEKEQLKAIVAVRDIRRVRTSFDIFDPEIPAGEHFQLEIIYEKDKSWRQSFPLDGIALTYGTGGNLTVFSHSIAKLSTPLPCTKRIVSPKDDRALASAALRVIIESWNKPYVFLPSEEQWLSICDHYSVWCITERDSQVINSLLLGRGKGKTFRACYFIDLEKNSLAYYCRLLYNLGYRTIILPACYDQKEKRVSHLNLEWLKSGKPCDPAVIDLLLI